MVSGSALKRDCDAEIEGASDIEGLLWLIDVGADIDIWKLNDKLSISGFTNGD
jgi:hypothetical protein